MSDFLAEMAEASRARAAELDEAALAVAATRTPPPPPFRAMLPDFRLIAEVKRSSPSEGALAAEVDPAARARTYAEAGATAVSVLTEPSRFGGSLDDLREVAAALRPLGVPAMRKDFLVDRRQVLEARAAGAGGVLLIATMLDEETLLSLLDAALGLSMFALVETFGVDELVGVQRLLQDRGCEARGGQVLVGMNCRNLRTLQIDPDRFPAVQHHPRFHLIAESGLHSPDDVERVATLGFSGALVGSALMRAADPGEMVRALGAAGVAGRARGGSFVKLCGLRTPEDVDAAVAAGADLVGFVVVDSPRRVSLDELPALAAKVPRGVLKIAVMRDWDAELVAAVAPHVDMIQCRAETLPDPAPRDVGILRVLRDGPELLDRLPDLAPHDWLLLDAPTEGSGQLPDLARIRAALQQRGPALTFLAGGLTPDNVAEVMAATGADHVDVSSGIEQAPGRKDPARMAAFVKQARLAVLSPHTSSQRNPSQRPPNPMETP